MAERLQRIVDILEERGTIAVHFLAQRLGVTEQTIRRDLTRLEGEGRVVRSHGGVALSLPKVAESPFATRLGEAAEQKRRIGVVAAALIKPGDCVILDAGTTTLAIARALGAPEGLKLITNGLPVASELAPRLGRNVIVAGGEVRGSTLSTVGAMARESFALLHAHKLFLACGGIHPERGLTNSNIEEAEVKQAMIAAADEVYAVAHGAKVSQVLLYSFAPLTAVKALITTDDAPSDVLDAIRKRGTEVILA